MSAALSTSQQRAAASASSTYVNKRSEVCWGCRQGAGWLTGWVGVCACMARVRAAGTTSACPA